jgi:hypothetical protein
LRISNKEKLNGKKQKMKKSMRDLDERKDIYLGSNKSKKDEK